MLKRTPETEAEFAKLGFFFEEQPSLSGMKFDGDCVTVDVEIGTVQADVEVPDFSVRIKSPRGLSTLITDWKLDPSTADPAMKILSFKATIPAPMQLRRCGTVYFDRALAMTFLDFCYYCGVEQISPDFKPDDVITPLRTDAHFTDIGWYIPTRIGDQLIDALSKLDSVMLGGNMEQAVLYLETKHMESA